MSNITHKDYAFAERDNQEHWVIHLTTGKYKDTYYCYDRVQLQMPEDMDLEDLDDPDVDATLSFAYGLIESPHDLNELAEDEEFNEHIGDVLRHIIEDSFDKGDYKIGSKDGETN